VLDLEASGHAESNGAAIRGWGNHGGANQKWYLHRHSREPGGIDGLLRANPDIGVDFKRYNSDVLSVSALHSYFFEPSLLMINPICRYITLPYNIISLIWKNKGLGNRVWRPESYDSDDFAFAMKAAVGDWVYDNIRAPVSISFEIYSTVPDHFLRWQLRSELCTAMTAKITAHTTGTLIMTSLPSLFLSP
jgi:hypothetical protein